MAQHTSANYTHRITLIRESTGFGGGLRYLNVNTGEWSIENSFYRSKIGTSLDPSNMRLDFFRVLNRARMLRVRFHDLRYTAASLMLTNRIPNRMVSKILGHSKPSITLGIYGHQYNEMLGEAARLMDELVSPVKIDLPSNVLSGLS